MAEKKRLSHKGTENTKRRVKKKLFFVTFVPLWLGLFRGASLVPCAQHIAAKLRSTNRIIFSFRRDIVITS